MKKWSLILLAAMGLPVAGWAALQAGVVAGPKSPGISVAFQGSLGVLNGEAKEHVFDNEVFPGERYQVSRLDWDLKNILMGGGNASVRLMDKLTLNGGYWAALTEGSGGEMDDYDWMNTGSTDWTHYSLSNVDVTEGYILDLNVAWDLVSLDALTARVMAGYKQNGWTWKDRGVYLLYPDYNYVPQDLNGQNMINYEQEFRMPYLGASVDWVLGGFTLSGNLIYSPAVSAMDWDEHVQRNLHFTETFEGGSMLGVGAEVRYAFSHGLFLSAAVDYQKIDLIVGDMVQVNIETGETGGGTDVAGIENEYLGVSLGGGIQF